MTDPHKLEVKQRDLKIKAKKIRKEGNLPANVFGEEKDSESIILSSAGFKKSLDKFGESSLIYLEYDGGDKSAPVLIDEVQYHPITLNPIHVSFKRVNLKEKTTSEIPVELVGENDVNQAVVVQTQDFVEVEALPADLPEKFEINIEELTEIGQSIAYKDLKFDKSKITLLIEEDKLDEPLVILQEVKEEVEEPEVEAATEAAGAEPAEKAEGEAKAEEAKE